jgi:hypothetical protein
MRTTPISFAEEFGGRVKEVSMFPSLRLFTLTDQSDMIEEGKHNA